MGIFWKFCLLLQVVGFLFARSASAALDPIVIQGSHFFYKTNGSEFFIRGVAYQQSTVQSNPLTFLDPLAQPTECVRDIPYLQELRTNVVHVYSIDAASDHSSCMQAFDEAGIYVLVDLSIPSSTINQNDPIWNTELFAAYASVIDSMQSYTNVLGFVAGNEISSNASNSAAAAYAKAAIRDMKNYIQTKNYRPMPVGYTTNQDPSIFNLIQDYYNCGNSSSSIDFLGLNIYSWCGDATYETSGYSVLTDSFSNYSVPVFFSEYGCNVQGGAERPFLEVNSLYGPQMTGTFSGGIVFEYFEESNDYGLVNVSGNSVSTLPDFNSLSTHMATVSPSSTAASVYTPSNTVARSCPTIGSSWLASETLPPTPNSDLCDCMVSSLSCAVGSGFNDSSAATILSQVCGTGVTICSGITSNGTTAQYGAYSVCNTTAQISWAMNQYYLSQNKASSSCDFSGNGAVKSPTSAGSQCQALLAQAGTDGTGTISSAALGPTSARSSPGPTSISGGGSSGSGASGSSGSGSSGGRGLSTGAKAGIAIGVVLVVLILVGALFLLWRRKRKPSGPPLSGEGLEVGEAPPQFTALRRAEMEANEAKHHHFISGDATESELFAHNIRVEDSSNIVNELNSDRERQELDSSMVATQISRRAELDELGSNERSGISTRGELSADSVSRALHTPRRKPVSSGAIPRSTDPVSQSTRSEWTNNPWTDPGVAGLAAASPVTKKSPAEEAEEAELRRLEDEERRIDEAIAESERLQALRKEKEELQRRRLEFHSRVNAGNTSAAPP